VAQIVFLTLYLGLISGRQPVALQADAAVTSVRLLLDGKTVETLGAPPWRGSVDFGAALQPHEIVAVGLGAGGREIARAAQFVNVPRHVAEIDVVLARDADGTPTHATIVARHLGQQEARGATLKLDDAAIAVDPRFSAALPAIDMRRPHVIAAEMHFADNTVARREVVFGGEFAEMTQAQLTPIALSRSGTSDAPLAEGCLVANGVPLRVRSVEKENAQVIVVRDPAPTELKRMIRISDFNLRDSRRLGALEDGTFLELLSAAPKQVGKNDEPKTTLFPVSTNFNASKNGVVFLLKAGRSESSDALRQWADATAVAGVRAAAGGRRRAVVVVVGSAPDKSDYPPAVVRKYLASLGVPLFVWWLGRPPAGVAETWGHVESISSLRNVLDATDRLRRALDMQRIAWVEADPLTALRAEVKEGCGYERAR
jgi:hypothetical protein